MDPAIKAVGERTTAPLALIVTTDGVRRKPPTGSLLGLRRLARALGNAVRPVLLRIDDVEMNTAACTSFARILRRGSTLRHLCLSDNVRVDASGLALLTQAMGKDAELEWFDAKGRKRVVAKGV